jgi:Flp pilus assembly pilin Flp
MPVSILLSLVSLLGVQLRSAARSRRLDEESGATTLELVIIALGLIAVATMLVVALTAAVKSRTDQIQ